MPRWSTLAIRRLPPDRSRIARRRTDGRARGRTTIRSGLRRRARSGSTSTRRCRERSTISCSSIRRAAGGVRPSSTSRCPTGRRPPRRRTIPGTSRGYPAGAPRPSSPAYTGFTAGPGSHLRSQEWHDPPTTARYRVPVLRVDARAPVGMRRDQCGATVRCMTDPRSAAKTSRPTGKRVSAQPIQKRTARAWGNRIESSDEIRLSANSSPRQRTLEVSHAAAIAEHSAEDVGQDQAQAPGMLGQTAAS